MAHVNTDLLNLIQSLKPFLGSRGLRMVEALEAIAELKETETAKKTESAIKALLADEETAIAEYKK
ncbi:MAG: hypothetical protein H0Z35_02900 [Thermoanaerobacteraceae bacterium]|nr:hypothetical protein [Thermoanaerobacteraceae bacterium]